MFVLVLNASVYLSLSEACSCQLLAAVWTASLNTVSTGALKVRLKSSSFLAVLCTLRNGGAGGQDQGQHNQHRSSTECHSHIGVLRIRQRQPSIAARVYPRQ